MTNASTRERLIPLVVVGGYLGAGKTTLVNHLLAGEHGVRLAVVVNDIGAVNIDVDLISAHDGDTYELTNGCICCPITDDLDATLTRIVASPDPVDAVVVEASGVAEPSRLGAIGGAWLGTEARGIVVVADAATLRDRVDDRFVGDLVRRQLDSADIIVLNKSDLREPDRLVDVATWLDNDSNRELLVTSRGRVGFPTLLAARSRSPHTGPEVPHAAALPRSQPSPSRTHVVGVERSWNMLSTRCTPRSSA